MTAGLAVRSATATRGCDPQSPRLRVADPTPGELVRPVAPASVLHAADDEPRTLQAVRRAVRGVLESAPGYRAATPEKRRQVAKSLVDVSLRAAELAAQDVALTRELQPRAKHVASPAASRASPSEMAGGLEASAAGPSIGDTGREGARVLSEMKDAIDFPSFVESLITGVFRAISNANVAQFERFSSLIENVAASSEDFARSVPAGAARQWAAQRFPGVSIRSGRLSFDDEADFESVRARLTSELGASRGEVDQVDESELEETLLPLVRRRLARDRQSILATMINMGLQRIVVDDGRLHASMDLRVDTDAVRERLRQQRDEIRVDAGASGGFGAGGWGAEAYVDTSVAHVRADSEYNQDQLRTQAGLRSSVDLAFRTEQVPLDRLADPAQRVRIQQQAPAPVTVGTTPSGGAARLRSEFGTIDFRTGRPGEGREHVTRQSVAERSVSEDAAAVAEPSSPAEEASPPEGDAAEGSTEGTGDAGAEAGGEAEGGAEA